VTMEHRGVVAVNPAVAPGMRRAALVRGNAVGLGGRAAWTPPQGDNTARQAARRFCW
jgi:hypothetical protein